jgi:chemotaxis protein histidine kinase CheA
MDDLIGEFITETSESLATLERTLADLARQPMTDANWDLALKLMHTIKGTCGFLQLPAMEKVAASSKELLERMRSSPKPNSSDLAALKAAMAQIRYMMDYLAKNGSEPSSQEIEQQSKPAPAAAPAPNPEPETKDYAPLNEQVHRAPKTVHLAKPAHPIAEHVPPMEERVSHTTLSQLVQARNQVKYWMGTNPRLRDTQSLLDQMVNDLKGKLLPRNTPPNRTPRLAKLLMIESGGLRFALPAEEVREVTRINDQMRHARLDEGAMMSLRGQWVPRLSLAQKLGQPSSAREAYALIIALEGRQLALCVEMVGALEELMLQPLPKLLRHHAHYAGAAILGDGSPCLILDSAGLLQLRDNQTVAPAKPAAAPRAEVSVPLTAQKRPVAFLRFRDGTVTPKAIALSQIGRVEQLDAAEIMPDKDGFTATCRGQMLRLKLLQGNSVPKEGELQAITLLQAPHIAILAHGVDGIVETEIALSSPTHEPILQYAELDGQRTAIVNTAIYLAGGAL